MYAIRKCKICGANINVHKHSNHFVLKNVCEHMPKEERISNKDIEEYLS